MFTHPHCGQIVIHSGSGGNGVIDQAMKTIARWVLTGTDTIAWKAPNEHPKKRGLAAEGNSLTCIPFYNTNVQVQVKGFLVGMWAQWA